MTAVAEQLVVALAVLAAATYAGWVLLRPLWVRRSPSSSCGGCSRAGKPGPGRP